jgi:hypothetical protein
MKVWIVIFPYNDGGHSIDGVFDSEEKAKSFVKSSQYEKFYEIEEHEIE